MFIHQTKWQQRLLNRYGNELSLLDATYRTTKYALPLFFLVVKSNVDYQVVGSFVLQSEASTNIEKALKAICSDQIHSCLQTFISNTARTATILNRDNTRRQCSKQYSRQCVETDQFWSLLRVNAQAANTR